MVERACEMVWELDPVESRGKAPGQGFRGTKSHEDSDILNL